MLLSDPCACGHTLGDHMMGSPHECLRCRCAAFKQDLTLSMGEVLAGDQFTEGGKTVIVIKVAQEPKVPGMVFLKVLIVGEIGFTLLGRPETQLVQVQRRLPSQVP